MVSITSIFAFSFKAPDRVPVQASFFLFKNPKIPFSLAVSVGACFSPVPRWLDELDELVELGSALEGKSTKTSQDVSPECPAMEYSNRSASSLLVVSISLLQSLSPSLSSQRRGRASIIISVVSSMRSRRPSYPLKRIMLPETSTTN